MSKVIVTGANGFIGTHLIRHLLAKSYQPTALVRHSSSVDALINMGVEVLRVDYTNQAELTQTILSVSPDFIIHNAGVTVAINESGYYDGNVLTTQNLISAAKKTDVQKFVLISSLAARGPGLRSKDSPISGYGRSKLRAEQLLKASGPPYSIVRPTAVYGPEDKAFLPVYSWAKKGIFIRLGSHSRKLTFVHVHDLVEIIVDSLRSDVETIYGWDGRVYAQADVRDALMRAFEKKGITIALPAFLFRLGTRIADIFIRRIFRQFWPYPPDKVAELIAEDWSIEEEYQTEVQAKFDLHSGFIQTIRHDIH